MRAATSVPPPALKPTRILIGLSGYFDCAWLAPLAKAAEQHASENAQTDGRAETDHALPPCLRALVEHGALRRDDSTSGVGGLQRLRLDQDDREQRQREARGGDIEDPHEAFDRIARRAGLQSGRSGRWRRTPRPSSCNTDCARTAWWRPRCRTSRSNAVLQHGGRQRRHAAEANADDRQQKSRIRAAKCRELATRARSARRSRSSGRSIGMIL